MISTPLSYFESMYGASRDPWDFAASAYEHRKYRATVAALPRRHYRNAFEPGCSIGVLSEILARRCQRLLATDIVSTALEQASERLAPFRHVRVEQLAIPRDWPSEVFDLVVLSEIGYYFDEATLREVMDLVVSSTTVGAHLVAVHWRGETDYPLSGDRTHELMSETGALRSVTHDRQREFVLDVWERE
jgi:hypothetical protein